MTILDPVVLPVLVLPSVAAVLLVPVHSSRWSLALMLSCTIPILGPILALVAARTKGIDQLTRDLDGAPTYHGRCDSPDDVRRMGFVPPVLERMLSLNPDERLGAVVTLSGRADYQAVSVLHWTVCHGDTDAALDAALTLEEIELRWERRLSQTLEAAEDNPSFDTAVAAARSLADGVLTGIAAPSRAFSLVKRARQYYEKAVELGPTENLGIERGRLELAAGSPVLAVELLDAALHQVHNHASRDLADLRLRARFAARLVFRADPRIETLANLPATIYQFPPSYAPARAPQFLGSSLRQFGPGLPPDGAMRPNELLPMN